MTLRHVLICAVATSSGVALAGTRDLAWSYGATTYAEGDVELQQWLTFREYRSPAQTPGGAPPSWVGGELRLGAIVAPADNWEVMAWGSLNQGPSLGADSVAQIGYGGIQVRRKLTPERTAGRPVDLLAVVEFVMPVDANEPHAYRAMGLLAGEADFGPLNLVANVSVVTDFDRTGAAAALDFSVGAMYRLSPMFLVGLEALGWNPFQASPEFRWVLYAGPTVTMQVGRFWAAVSATWGADKKAANADGLFDPNPMVLNGFWARLIMGTNF